MPYRIGQTATNPKTGQKVKWDGSNWVAVSGTGGAGAAGSKPSQTTEKFFNELRNQANDAAEARRIYEEARKPIETLKPSPGRGRFMQMMTPEEGGGVLDTIGGVIGAIPRAIGAITPEETNAYQQLRGYQSQQVLRRQLEQKGPQTESDAARLALTELSPSKSKEVNEDIINKGIQRTARAQARAVFYQRFSQRWGLNGRDAQGRTADEIWANEADKLTREIIGGIDKKPTTTIRVVSRRKIR